MDELKQLKAWIQAGPRGPEHLSQPSVDITPLEVAAFALLLESAVAMLALMLDLTAACGAAGGPDQRSQCAGGAPQQLDRQVLDLRADLDAQMRTLLADYAPGPGVRSAVIRTGQNVRSDLDRFARDLPSLADWFRALQRGAGVVQLIGQRSRMLAHQLGMHAWVRTLAVPGRGATVFIFHDEYLSPDDLLRTLVMNMVRNGQVELSMGDIGVSVDGDPRFLLREFQGLHYFGILLGDREAAQGPEDLHRSYLQARERLGEFSNRAVLQLASSADAARAIPLHSLDMVFLNAEGRGEHVALDLQWWEARIKPGGVLAGRGFGPGFPESVRAICDRRFSNEIHLGIGGTFWWYVEPDEQE